MARLMPLEEKARGPAAIETMLALRDSGRIKTFRMAFVVDAST